MNLLRAARRLVFFEFPTAAVNAKLERGRDKLDQVTHTAGVAPLVVVPGQHFYAFVANHFGVTGVDNGRVGVSFEVGGNEFFFGIGEDALERAFRGRFERGVDGIFCGGFVDEDGEVHNADVWRGNAHGVAVEFTFEFGNDQMQGFGGAGGTGNHVNGRCACSAKVLVRQGQKFLIVGVGMDGGHGAAVNAESVVENFGDRSEAVCGAGSVGDDVVLAGIVGFVVDAENESGIGLVSGRGNDDFFHGAANVLGGFGTFGEKAGGFDHDIGADTGPIDLRRIFDFENLEGTAVHGDGIFGVGNFVGKIPEDGIVFEQMREGGGVRDVIHGYELNILVIQSGADDVATDTAKAVDTYFNGHYFLRCG